MRFANNKTLLVDSSSFSPSSHNILSCLIFTSAPLSHIITARCLPEILVINNTLNSPHVAVRFQLWRITAI